MIRRRSGWASARASSRVAGRFRDGSGSAADRLTSVNRLSIRDGHAIGLPLRAARAILAGMDEVAAGRADDPAAVATPAGHFTQVDGLRAVAALFVFFTHVGATRYQVGQPISGLNNAVRVSMDELTVGVQIFFAISGFVVF